MKLSYTNRARVLVALSPIFLPLILLEALPYAIWRAVGQFWWYADFSGALRLWYRNVWRVAVYGSVHDSTPARRPR